MARLKILTLAILLMPGVVNAATTYTVSSTADAGGDCTLRTAVAAINAAGDTSNVIDLTGLTGAIVLRDRLTLSVPVHINGPGAGVLTIIGDGWFDVAAASVIRGVTLTGGMSQVGLRASADLTLEDVAIVDNTAPSSPVLAFEADATLTIRRSFIANNHAGSFGVIYVNGARKVAIEQVRVDGNVSSSDAVLRMDAAIVAITASRFSGNSGSASSGSGGALEIIACDDADTVAITTSTFDGNSGENGGGAAVTCASSSNPAVTVLRSTFSGNTATGSGGGLYVKGSLRVDTSTFDANSAAIGGAIAQGSTVFPVAVVFSTLSGNSAATSSAVDATNGSQVAFTSSILAGGNAFVHAPGALVSYSFIEDTTGFVTASASAHNATGASPELSALADNGGPTETRALSSTSPARNVAGTTTTTTDQRGEARVAFDVADMGAYEYQSAERCVNCVVAPCVPNSSDDASCRAAVTEPAGATLIACTAPVDDTPAEEPETPAPTTSTKDDGGCAAVTGRESGLWAAFAVVLVISRRRARG